MRKEASIEQWKELYEIVTRIKELKPWEKFWDMDLIGIDMGEDIVICSILGKGRECYGISIYEGYEGLNNLLMLFMHQRLNLSSEYAMAQQNSLTCYWGNRNELTDKQRKIIKELGYTYRGKNQWLYFLSFKSGYTPYNMDEEEVLRMSEYMQRLEKVLKYYEMNAVKVDFENGNMLYAEFGKNGQIEFCEERYLPFASYQLSGLNISDEELLSDLSNVPKCNAVLEADIVVLGATIADKKYERPANPFVALLGDEKSGAVIKFEIVDPEVNENIVLANMLISFIFNYGAPKEVLVTNVIVETELAQICQIAGIKLQRVNKLKGLDNFITGFRRFDM